jgi:CARDB
MPRRLVTFALLGLAFAVAVPGQAQAAFKLPSAKMLECRSSDSADSRSAIFLGRMRAIPGTDRMLMRFTLRERFGDEKLHSVTVPELRAWRSAKPGIKDFRYKQTVTGLQGGGEYRVTVDFRWLDADGNLLRKARRQSGVCRQEGELANLKIGLPSALPGPEGTAVYFVRVVNDGKAVARDVAVELFVDGAATNVSHIDSVAPGETREARFTGPACKRNLRMVVDPGDSIKERLESDNVSLVRCPTLVR